MQRWNRNGSNGPKTSALVPVSASGERARPGEKEVVTGIWAIKTFALVPASPLKEMVQFRKQVFNAFEVPGGKSS